MASDAMLQDGMTNVELREAWFRKLPNVEPTDRDLSAFALGVEVGAARRPTQKYDDTLLPFLALSDREDAERWRYAVAIGGNQVMNWLDIYDDWNGEDDFTAYFDLCRAEEEAARSKETK